METEKKYYPQIAKKLLQGSYSQRYIGFNIPISPTDLAVILSAHCQGQFQRSAILSDQLLSDGWIATCLNTRISNVINHFRNGFVRTIEGEKVFCKYEIVGEEDLVAYINNHYDCLFSVKSLSQIQRTNIFLGFSLSQIVWDNWVPKIKPWHLGQTYWDQSRQVFVTQTTEGMLDICEEDVDWMLHSNSFIERSWLTGLVRSLAGYFLNRLLADRDWGRHNTVHGLPLKLAYIPDTVDPQSESDFTDSLAQLSAESVIPCRRGPMGQEGWDLKLLEPQSNSTDAFRLKIEQIREDIAVAILGQNLTTLAGDRGSYASAEVHMDTLQAIVHSDLEALIETFNQQLLPKISFRLTGTKTSCLKFTLKQQPMVQNG